MLRLGLRCRPASWVAPLFKQWLAAKRHLFDWLVNGQVVPINPTHSVREPPHVATSGQIPVLDPSEARALLDSIDTSTRAGLRDRALLGLMVCGCSLSLRDHSNCDWLWWPRPPFLRRQRDQACVPDSAGAADTEFSAELERGADRLPARRAL